MAGDYGRAGPPIMRVAVNLLAFDTSTETMSIAVQAGSAVLEHTAAGGPLASATLIPSITALLGRAGLALAQLDAIGFGRGPGSFTGLRTAAAVAQGLGFGAGVAVLPLDTLLAVAEEAHAQSGVSRVVALLDARMGEVYCAAYERQDGAWHERAPAALLRPEQVAVPPGWALAGNVFAQHGDRLPAASDRIPAVPTARALLRLLPAQREGAAGHPPAKALPLYIRDKVAQTTEERAAERARKDSHRQ